jgi:hypothetical protein
MLTVMCLGEMGFLLLTPDGINWKDRLYKRFPEISFAVRALAIGANMGFSRVVGGITILKTMGMTTQE